MADNTTTDPQQAAPTPETAAGRTYTEEEVQAKLRGQAKELEKLRTAEGDLRKQIEATMAARTELEAKIAEAAKTTEATKAESAEERRKREALESLMTEEVAQTLAAVDDEATRARWTGLLEKQPLIERRRLLNELVALRNAGAPPSPTTGAAGKPKPKDVPFEEAIRSPRSRIALATELLRRSKEQV